MIEFTLCPFALLLGQPCPGCGMGRALWSCCVGDLRVAFEQHPLAPGVFVLGSLLLPGYALGRQATGRPSILTKLAMLPQYPALQNMFWCVVLIATLGIWIARFFGAFGGPVAVHSPLVDWLANPPS